MGMAAPTAVESAPEPAETSGLASASSLVPSRSPASARSNCSGSLAMWFDHVMGVLFGQALHLVVEREQFAGLGAVHLDGLALAGDFGHVDFALALGGQIRAGAHREGRGDQAGEAGQQHIFAVAGGGAADAADDAEDGAQAVVDAVDGVADPTARLLAALGALGQHLIENRLGVDLVRAGGRRVVAAQQRPQLLVVVLLVLDDVFEDGDGFRVAQRLQLLAVAGDGAALLDLQPARAMRMPPARLASESASPPGLPW